MLCNGSGQLEALRAGLPIKGSRRERLPVFGAVTLERAIVTYEPPRGRPFVPTRAQFAASRMLRSSSAQFHAAEMSRARFKQLGPIWKPS